MRPMKLKELVNIFKMKTFLESNFNSQYII